MGNVRTIIFIDCNGQVKLFADVRNIESITIQKTDFAPHFNEGITLEFISGITHEYEILG